MNTLQPLPDYSDAALAAFTTDELLELLARDEDRVPRNVIDECARRGDAILPHLRRVLEQYLWDAEMPMGQWWRLLHAVMILGLIPTAAAGLLLVETMRRMSEEDDDNLQGWLTSDWPALFGNKPDTLIEALRTLSADRDSDWYIRAGARDAMVAMAHRMGAATLEAALEMLAASAQDETEDWDYRLLTANALLDFPRPQYRELLQALAKRQKGFGTVLSRDYIEEAYAAAQDQPRWTQHPWNPWDFYKPQVIAARQERWAEEDRKALERGNRLAEGEDYGDDDDDDDDDAYAFTEPYVRDTPKVGRNDPCPCGSGKKYKKCCLGDDMAG